MNLTFLICKNSTGVLFHNNKNKVEKDSHPISQLGAKITEIPGEKLGPTSFSDIFRNRIWEHI